MLTSALDNSRQGIANVFRALTRSPADPQTLYKDSYLPAPAVMTPGGLAILPATRGAGWLVSLAEGRLIDNGNVQPNDAGTYLRLLMDGSVLTRHNHIRQDFPTKGLRDYQDMAWWYTDDDNAFEAKSP